MDMRWKTVEDVMRVIATRFYGRDINAMLHYALGNCEDYRLNKNGWRCLIDSRWSSPPDYLSNLSCIVEAASETGCCFEIHRHGGEEEYWVNALIGNRRETRSHKSVEVAAITAWLEVARGGTQDQ